MNIKEGKNSLGAAQQELEMAAKAFQNSQAALVKANEANAAAEERYNVAVASLNSSLVAVRQQTKVVPLGSR